jgi:L-ribulose-5-phosphate 3-epimerase
VETRAPASDTDFRWGVYEKALPKQAAWPELLSAAGSAGYRFVEMSMDETDERLERLEWSAACRRALHEALDASPVKIDSMCLSAHRKYALGSVSRPLRERALQIMRRAIDFAAEYGIRIVQVAGYDVHYEPSTEETRELYREAIVLSAGWARDASVMLGLENVECPLVDSIEGALHLVEAAGTPWFQLYPDIGNLTAMEKDVSRELLLGGRRIVGLHLKDTRVREFRRVPFGQGIVDFEAAFLTLKKMGYRGPLMVEMWNESEPDPVATVAAARQWLGEKLRSAFGRD